MIKIRKTNTEDTKPFQEMCFEVYRESYIYPELGFDEGLLSREIFFNRETTQYFADMLTNNESQQSYVADDGGEIVGGVTIYQKNDSYVIGGYYVKKDRQGEGIGKALWEKVEQVTNGSTLKLTVNAHAWKSVNMYFKKGFVIDPENPRLISHWEEWPQDKKFLMYGMIRKGKSIVNKVTVNNPVRLEQAKLYADGGSRGNPGPSAGGYVILDMEDNVVKSNGKYLGITTNNQAEYHSLKGGIEMAITMGIRELDVYMDSLLVINQMKGIYKIRNRDLWPIHDSIKQLLPKFEKMTFTHVPRELNKLADAEVNQALDAQKNV